MVKSILLLMITNVLKRSLREQEPLLTGTLNSIAYAKLLKEVSIAFVAFSKKLVVALPLCIFLGVLVSFIYLDLVHLVDHKEASLNPSFYLNLFATGTLLGSLYFLFKKRKESESVVDVRAERVISPQEITDGANLASLFLSKDFFEDILTSFSKGFRETYNTSSQTLSVEEFKKGMQQRR